MCYIYIYIWGRPLHNFIASVIVVLRAALARTEGTKGTLQLLVASVGYVVEQLRLRIRRVVIVSLRASLTSHTSCPGWDVGSHYAVVE